MKILGAGMAGCLMGVLNPGAEIYEAATGLPNTHRAVLRFRDDKISKTTGIPFKKVKVYKSIWADGKERMLGAQWMNKYSQKVTGKIQPRSIVNLDTVERYIAPSDFHNMLADRLGDNIHFNHCVESITSGAIYFNNAPAFQRFDEPIVSTIPMNVMADLVREAFDTDKVLDFNHQPITVTRFTIKDCDVYQTIYYPKFNTPVYRATLTGENLIVESIGIISHNNMIDVLDSFGLSTFNLGIEGGEAIDLSHHIQSTQQYGKISPIDNRVRRSFMLMLTQKYNIYSAGRFACWQNILLDDVYEDNFKIRAMINSDPYDRFKGART